MLTFLNVDVENPRTTCLNTIGSYQIFIDLSIQNVIEVSLYSQFILKYQLLFEGQTSCPFFQRYFPKRYRNNGGQCI